MTTKPHPHPLTLLPIGICDLSPVQPQEQSEVGTMAGQNQALSCPQNLQGKPASPRQWFPEGVQTGASHPA